MTVFWKKIIERAFFKIKNLHKKSRKRMKMIKKLQKMQFY